MVGSLQLESSYKQPVVGPSRPVEVVREAEIELKILDVQHQAFLRAKQLEFWILSIIPQMTFVCCLPGMKL